MDFRILDEMMNKLLNAGDIRRAYELIHSAYMLSTGDDYDYIQKEYPSDFRTALLIMGLQD